MKNFPEPNSRSFYFVSIVNMNSLSAASQFRGDMLKVLVILSFDKFLKLLVLSFELLVKIDIIKFQAARSGA